MLLNFVHFVGQFVIQNPIILETFNISVSLGTSLSGIYDNLSCNN